MKSEIKTDFYTGGVVETGTKIGIEKAREYTKEIKVYTSQEEKPIKEIGFWTGTFFIIIFLLYFFRGR